jgi:hypothetical protein
MIVRIIEPSRSVSGFVPFSSEKSDFFALRPSRGPESPHRTG